MPSLEDTERYFDERSNELQPQKLIDKWAAVRTLFEGLPDGAHIVECGAGTGLYTIPLLQAGYHVHAVDLSAKSLARVEELASRLDLAKRLKIHAGDFNEIVRELTGRIDAVAFIKVLHHFPDSQAISKGIRQAFDVIRDDGRIVGFEPNGDSPFWMPWLRLRGGEVWKNEKNVRLIRSRLFVSLFEELAGVNWELDYCYCIPGFLTTRNRTLQAVDRFLTQLPVLRRIALNTRFIVRKQSALR